jgi:hypothetical protein
MKMKKLLAILCLCFCVPMARGDTAYFYGNGTGGGIAYAVLGVASPPTTCTYSDTADPVTIYQGTLYACGTGGTYVAIIGGSGISSLNGLTGATQTFATPGTSGTAPAWVSTGTSHTLNIPMAATATVTAGLISKTEYDVFNGKQAALGFTAVPNTRTVAGKALSSDITLASTDLSDAAAINAATLDTHAASYFQKDTKVILYTDYGSVDTNYGADDTTAWQAAVNACASPGCKIIAPPGQYKVTDLAITTPGLEIDAQGTSGGGPGTGGPQLGTVSFGCATAGHNSITIGSRAAAIYHPVRLNNITFRDVSTGQACAGGLRVINTSYVELNNVAFQGFHLANSATPTTPGLTPGTAGSLTAGTWYVAISDTISSYGNETDRSTPVSTTVSSSGSIALAAHTYTSPMNASNVWLGSTNTIAGMHLVAHDVDLTSGYTITTYTSSNANPLTFNQSGAYGLLAEGSTAGFGLAGGYTNQIVINNPQVLLGVTNAIVSSRGSSTPKIAAGNINLYATPGCGIITNGSGNITTHIEGFGSGSYGVCATGYTPFFNIGLDQLATGSYGIYGVNLYRAKIFVQASQASASPPPVTLDSGSDRNTVEVKGAGLTASIDSGTNNNLCDDATGICTYNGSKIVTRASTSTAAGFNLPHGTAPSSPVNGDVWTTSSGLYTQINSSTVGPLSTAISSYSSIVGLWTTCSSGYLKYNGTCDTPSGGGTVTASDTPAQYDFPYWTNATNLSKVTAPSVNGLYSLVYNITGSAAVAPTKMLAGVPVNNQTGSTYTLLYSDRATYLPLTGGSTFTLTLPAASGNLASNLPFLVNNKNSGNLTVTPTTPNNIDGGSSQASATVLPNWAAWMYQDSASPINWWSVKVPTYGAFGSTCTNGITWSTSTGFGCAAGTPVTSAASLTSTALMTGAGSQGAQTPSATSTLDASGNLAVAAGGSVGSADTGTPKLTFATNKVTLNQPLYLGTTSGQLVTGTSTNLTTITFPASSGAVTVTGPNVTSGLIYATAQPAAGIAAFAGSTYAVTSTTSPALGTATATSLLASGIVDGSAPVAVTTASSCTLGTTSGCSSVAYNSGYTFNQHATAATAITYTLPTAAAGKQYCVKNSYNGSAANTGTITLQTSASGQYIIYNGTLSATGGYVISGGAAGDGACVVGVDATHWSLYVQVGTWTLH